ncbi:MAG TPA: hypothetical protein PLS53_06495 [Thermoanaerobaculaceae bacterium]|nr:hypothetical protein [Thermoanaerobaculaceae bacterium]HPS77785.1 hypothetical protein [Thermoanaerobaculaceae bacterium]
MGCAAGAPRLAFFVSPHGFGHAARACAVMQAMREVWPDVAFEVFTLVPEWFFAESLGDGFRHHLLRSDVGLVQRTTLDEDPEATARVLESFVPFDAAALGLMADLLHNLGCEAVLADISPLGIAIGHAAGLPTVLVENFTWDWIYQAYTASVPALAGPAELLHRAFGLASMRVRCRPACGEVEAGHVVSPISRPPRTGRDRCRRELGVDKGRPVVLVTMGGTPWRLAALAPLLARRDVAFVIPGGADDYRWQENLVLLPHHSRFHHPDLVAAADVVIGKVGYSTVAEVYHSGVPFGFVPRRRFPESPYLERFVRESMSGREISPREAESSEWVRWVDTLIHLPRRPTDCGGARQVVALVAGLLGEVAGCGKIARGVE